MSTRTLTDAERVDLLLGEVARLRHSREQERETLNLERTERGRERQIEAQQYAKLDRECDRWAGETQAADEARWGVERERDEAREQLAAVRQDLAISEAANEALRAALRVAELERETAVTLQRAAETNAAWAQAENERLSAALASALESEPAPAQSWSFTVGEAVGIGIGAFLVAASLGAVAAAEVLGRLPW